MADWGGGFPYASGGDLLVCDEEDGDYADSGDYIGADVGFGAAAECLFGGYYGG